MSDVYIVLGMHRSGTSLVSSMLHVGGVEMCRHRCGQGTKSQPYGHFEDEQFKALNNLILFAAGGDWKNPPADDKIIDGVRPFHRAMDMQIKARAVNRPVWGWKDPRTVLTAVHWHKLLVITGHKPHYIITKRSPMEIIDSLVKRSPSDTTTRWPIVFSVYNALIAKFRYEYEQDFDKEAGFPFITINYNDLIGEYGNYEALKLAQFAGIEDELDKMVAQIRRRTAEGW